MTALELLRHEAGWTQEELAYEAGVSSWTIKRLEKGVFEARNRTLAALAGALEVPLKDMHKLLEIVEQDDEPLAGVR
jgi:transcriptional regulator with XRE-family HTH domain